MIATKTARIVTAAAGRPIWDFSLRRLHGPAAAVGVARAAYIAGAAGTATLVAGKDLGIPTTGTMAHHFVLAFTEDQEQLAFEQFLRDYPENGVLLIDTYDTQRGCERAIAAAVATKIPLKAIRLDSGDLDALSRYCRQRLNDAGMDQTRILASNDLDEYTIEQLVAVGAPIDSFGVGTMLGTSADAPALGGVYKLVRQQVKGKTVSMMKRAPGKQTDPGAHQVYRTDSCDIIDLQGPSEIDGVPLLRTVMKAGQITFSPTLTAIRERASRQLQTLSEQCLRLRDPEAMLVERSDRLWQLRTSLGDQERIGNESTSGR
jgi:nicotinate phosphoribosyltransferase